MPAETTRDLSNVILEILEKQAFLFGEPLDKEMPKTEGPFLRALIAFTGPMQGRLSVVAPQSLVQIMAANMLGLEPEDEKTQRLAQDAFKEFLNVLCGAILVELAGTAPAFHLSLPEIWPIASIEWKNFLACPEALCIETDEGPLSVLLLLG